MNLKLQFPKLNKPKKNMTQKTNLELLKIPEYAKKYKEQLNEKQNDPTKVKAKTMMKDG